jgi:hypothetical protein
VSRGVEVHARRVGLEPAPAQQEKALYRFEYKTCGIPAHQASVKYVLDQQPSVVAAELGAASAGQTWEFVRRFRQDGDARLVPCIVYGHRLQADDIETAAQAGALWLQLELSDSARLLAAEDS